MGRVVTGRLAGARPHRSFPWLRFGVLGFVVLVFAAAIAEIGLRIADLRASNLVGLQCVGTSTLLQGQKGLYVLDVSAGYVMRPNTCVRLRAAEYDGVLRTNSQGMVGPEVAATKPDGEFRILVLGDSYVVGGQVPYEQTFPAVLEQRLKAAGYPRVRVINAGVGGYTTFNEAGLLRARLAVFQPDLVVVAAYLGNDVSENILAVAAGYRQAPEHPKGVTWGLSAQQLVDDSGTWFGRNRLGAPRMPPPWNPAEPLPEPVGNSVASSQPASASQAPPPSALEVVRHTARVAWDGARSTSLLLGRFSGVPIDPSVSTAPGSLPMAVEQKKLNLTSFEWTILRDLPRTYWLDVAWPLFGRYLAEVRDTAASSGAPVVVLVIPDMEQFDDQMRARAMYEFRFRDEEVDWDRPQRELAAQADATGLPVLDLLPQFRSMADRADLYLRFDTHFTARGHDVTAAALAEYLQHTRYVH